MSPEEGFVSFNFGTREGRDVGVGIDSFRFVPLRINENNFLNLREINGFNIGGIRRGKEEDGFFVIVFGNFFWKFKDSTGFGSNHSSMNGCAFTKELGGVVNDVHLDGEVEFGVEGLITHDGITGVAKEFSHPFAEWAFHSLEVFDWVDGVELEV